MNDASEPDIRVTRERVREHERRADAGLGLDFGDWLLDAVWDLARNDLAEHPADDGESITAVRVLDAGFRTYGILADYQGGLSLDGLEWHECQVWHWAGTRIPNQPKTWGDLRRLCVAIGITLREPHMTADPRPADPAVSEAVERCRDMLKPGWLDLEEMPVAAIADLVTLARAYLAQRSAVARLVAAAERARGFAAGLSGVVRIEAARLAVAESLVAELDAALAAFAGGRGRVSREGE